MSDLWEYPEVAAVPNWGAASNIEDAPCDSEEEDGQGRRKKPKKQAKKQQVVKGRAACAAAQHEANLDVDSDDDFEIVACTAAKAGGMGHDPAMQDDDDFLCMGARPSSSNGPAAHGAGSATTAPAAVLSESARAALERTQQLQRQRMAMLKEDAIALADSPGKAAAGGKPASMRAAPAAMQRAAAAAAAAAARDEDDDDVVEIDDPAPPQQQQQQRRASGAAAAAGPSSAAKAGGAAAAAVPAGDKVLLKCQCRHGEVSISLRQTDTLSKLRDAFLSVAQGKGWLRGGGIPDGFKMCFDGEALKNAKLEQITPNSLGLAEGDAIDVEWKA